MFGKQKQISGCLGMGPRAERGGRERLKRDPRKPSGVVDMLIILTMVWFHGWIYYTKTC